MDGDFNVSRSLPKNKNYTGRQSRGESFDAGHQNAPTNSRIGGKERLCIRLKTTLKKLIENTTAVSNQSWTPVDYFYRWMVEILADGDAHALGDYPYATPHAITNSMRTGGFLALRKIPYYSVLLCCVL